MATNTRAVLPSTLSYAEETGAMFYIHGSVHAGNAYDGVVNPYLAHRSADDDAASIGEESADELDETATFQVADEMGHQLEIKKHDEGRKKSAREEDDEIELDEAPHSVIGSGIESLKYLYSTALLIFSLTLVMAAIFSKQTIATAENGFPPIAAFCVFWFLVCWLAMMEGGQGALIGLQPIDKSKYASSHQRALKNTTLAHRGDNMERFIVGRQFLVVLVVFVLNMMASAVPNANVLGIDSGIAEVFLGAGVAVTMVTIMLGQLTAQGMY